MEAELIAPAPTTKETILSLAQNKAEAPKKEEPVVEAPKEDPKFSGKFAALAKREKAIAEQQAKFKAEREAWEKEKQTYITNAPTEFKKSFDEQLKTDPVKALESIGWTYNEITKFILNDNKLTPEQQMKQIQERLDRKEREEKERFEAAEKEQVSAKQKAVETQIENFKKGIGQFIKDNGDTYEFLREHPGNVDLVYDVIAQYYEQTDKAGHAEVLDIEAAAKHAEAYIENDIKEKLSRIKKFGLTPESKEGQKILNEAPKKTASPTTLTNSQAAAAPTPTAKASMSREESLKAAAALLRWS